MPGGAGAPGDRRLSRSDPHSDTSTCTRPTAKRNDHGQGGSSRFLPSPHPGTLTAACIQGHVGVSAEKEKGDGYPATKCYGVVITPGILGCVQSLACAAEPSAFGWPRCPGVGLEQSDRALTLYGVRRACLYSRCVPRRWPLPSNPPPPPAVSRPLLGARIDSAKLRHVVDVLGGGIFHTWCPTGARLFHDRRGFHTPPSGPHDDVA